MKCSLVVVRYDNLGVPIAAWEGCWSLCNTSIGDNYRRKKWLPWLKGVGKLDNPGLGGQRYSSRRRNWACFTTSQTFLSTSCFPATESFSPGVPNRSTTGSSVLVTAPKPSTNYWACFQTENISVIITWSIPKKQMKKVGKEIWRQTSRSWICTGKKGRQSNSWVEIYRNGLNTRVQKASRQL